jgi:membrane peptidoglycan carboxypeptidase
MRPQASSATWKMKQGRLDLEEDGLIITTTLDLTLQNHATVHSVNICRS